MKSSLHKAIFLTLYFIYPLQLNCQPKKLQLQNSNSKKKHSPVKRTTNTQELPLEARIKKSILEYNNFVVTPHYKNKIVPTENLPLEPLSLENELQVHLISPCKSHRLSSPKKQISQKTVFSDITNLNTQVDVWT